MEYLFSLFPVILFLVCLYLLDSFKLVSQKLLIICVLWGILSAGLSYLVNTALFHNFSVSQEALLRYAAPVVEEVLKALLIVLLIKMRRIGFSIDAAIYGFAIGTGFSLTENIVYIAQLGTQTDMIIWMLRGFGTAIMHGGCSALLAMIMITGVQRNRVLAVAFLPGLAAAVIIHSMFNHFLLNPFLQTALIITVLPILFMLIFRQSTNMLQDWLEIEFSSEVDMLKMIRRGAFEKTKAGQYLSSIKHHYTPEVIVDMYWYISLYLELSIKAKRNMMLKENGLPIIPEKGIKEKLIELKQLRKQIGKVGEISLQPLIRMRHRELWKLNQL